MPLILKDVSYSYGHEPVLKNINITAREGAPTAIMGVSGRGKTTLLHLMAGLLVPDRGEISGIPQKGVSVVFQENRLLPWLSVLENLKVAAPAVPTAELTVLLGELGLAGWEQAKPDALSGGMARRVAIARALAFGSPLLLLDEPFSGLDSDTKRKVAQVILSHSAGSMVVAVVHDEADAGLLGAGVVRI